MVPTVGTVPYYHIQYLPHRIIGAFVVFQRREFASKVLYSRVIMQYLNLLCTLLAFDWGRAKIDQSEWFPTKRNYAKDKVEDEKFSTVKYLCLRKAVLHLYAPVRRCRSSRFDARSKWSASFFRYDIDLAKGNLIARARTCWVQASRARSHVWKYPRRQDALAGL